MVGAGLGSGRFLLGLTLAAIAGGTAAGLAFNGRFGVSPVPMEWQYLAFPGQLFLRMLKQLTVPLVIASNVSSAASLAAKARPTPLVS